MLRVAAIFVIFGGGAQAGVCTGAVLQFVESAPRDRFELTVADAPLGAVEVDFGGSAGQLVFDTAAGGTGVEVFQPLRDEGGTMGGTVADGAQTVRVILRDGRAGSRAIFSIDVDDRRAVSDLGQIRVTGAEISGATATFEALDGARHTAVFDGTSRAQMCG